RESCRGAAIFTATANNGSATPLVAIASIGSIASVRSVRTASFSAPLLTLFPYDEHVEQAGYICPTSDQELLGDPFQADRRAPAQPLRQSHLLIPALCLRPLRRRDNSSSSRPNRASSCAMLRSAQIG